MSRCQERESVEKVLVVDLHALGKTRARIAGHDQADEHAIDVDLMAVGRGSAAKTPAVRKGRIDGGIERDDVAGESVGDRNWPAQIDGVDDVETRPFERR